ncbi:uncharacterized protein LOC115395249 [Salarias fasciatus]|uniref:uncharacterized protein LOC115395249 n=1 Tax=Salarias fasciatus TaxID=181472 RepID=UPI001176AE83|nr:uncharacterized protein LOC115395249 [Salarias fasciatus]XP_029956554.1 uncharacterized protein LOC115395249 [Salarias fasciatus]
MKSSTICELNGTTRARLEMLEKTLDASNLTASAVQGNDDKFQMLTGITWEIFEKVFGLLSPFLCSEPKNKSSLPLVDQLFITLVMLRHNMSFELLAQLKDIPTTTAIDYFWKWVDLIYSKLGFMIKWQDRDTIFQTIPPVFKAEFPHLTSIIDCIEIFIDAPKDPKARAQTWSNHKKHCTVKVFVSCSPVGSINFLSCLWGGGATDVHVVRESGFISSSLHMPDDQILADRRFLFHEDLAVQCGAELLTPASTKGKKQLSARELETSRKISSVRVHIERVIGLLKNR